MTREDFESRLLEATTQAIHFARKYVHDCLPDQVRYRLLLNRSHDANRQTDEFVYPEDEDVDLWLLDHPRIVDILWRNGTCPVWIDTSVVAVSAKWTIVELFCAGRYSSDEQRLYYAARGTRPFAAKSPVFPPLYCNLDFSKFSEFSDELKWRLPRVPWLGLRWLLQRTNRLSSYMDYIIRRLRRRQYVQFKYKQLKSRQAGGYAGP